MHKFTVEDPAGFAVGSGEIVGLSAEQLATRSHRVEVLDDKPGAVVRVRVLEAVQFKSGEVVHLDRAPKDSTGTAALAKPPAAAKAPKAKKSEIESAHAAGVAEGHAAGVVEGRAAMLAEVVAHNDALDAQDSAGDAVEAAEAALAAEADAEKQKPLQAALDEALAQKAAADKAVADLPELKA